MASLLRYKRHFQLPLRPNAPKAELMGAVRKHFTHHPKLKDVEVISAFLYANQQARTVVQQQAATPIPPFLTQHKLNHPTQINTANNNTNNNNTANTSNTNNNNTSEAN